MRFIGVDTPEQMMQNRFSYPQALEQNSAAPEKMSTGNQACSSPEDELSLQSRDENWELVA